MDKALETADGADEAAPDVEKMRTLLAVAAALRRLAADTPAGEASLYLAAAGKLARRAAMLGGLLPEPPPPPAPPTGPLYRPVDINI